MKTPKEYTDNIRNGVITKEILEDCLLSVNVRSKIARNQESHYRNYYRYDRYDNERKYREKKDELYRIKDTMLGLLHPSCIHEEFVSGREKRFYEYEFDSYEAYNKAMDAAKKDDLFIRTDFSLDFSHTDEYIPSDMIDIALMEGTVLKDNYFAVKKPRYYLYYEVGEHSFHHPIDGPDSVESLGLPIKRIDEIRTRIIDETELVSLQFVKKVIDLIDSGDYEFCDD